MKLNELCADLDVSMKLIHQFMKYGIFDDLKMDIVDDDYGKKAFKRVESCACLYSLGLDVKSVMVYVSLENSQFDTRKERITILENYRNKSLKNVHRTKHKIDYLNCLMREFQTK